MRRLLKHPAVHLASLTVLCFVGYGQGLDRYFVSEDFFVLRRLITSSLSETTWAHLTGPLLEISFVQFYRPVSAFLLQLETLLWGIRPGGYLVTHLLVHLLNVGLVYRLAGVWSRGSRASAYGVALIFAVYPLHPNVVLFISGFATLFSTTFLLASLTFYETYRSSRDRGPLAGALLCFAFALGSYEQAVILPGLIVVRECLAIRFRTRPKEDQPGQPLAHEDPWRHLIFALRPIASFAAVLVIYFVVRQAALGEVVAGYEGFRQRWVAAEFIRLGHGILEGLSYLIYPDFARKATDFAALTSAVLAAGGSAWAYRRGGVVASFWFSGLAWILASQAPFSFAHVTPGNGRYWYLTSIGLGLCVVAMARWLARGLSLLRPQLNKGLAVASLTSVIGAAYWIALIHNTRVYADAGETTSIVQGHLLEARQTSGERLFVVGHPDFLKNANTNIAQVFHWGLSDAMAPPFVEPGPIVYPMPLRFTDGDLIPILERSDLGPTWRWSPSSGTLARVGLAPGPDLPRITTRRGGAGEWQFQAVEGSHRLVLITRGGSSLHPVAEPADFDGWTSARPPAVVVQSMRHLYGDDIFFWIEARTEGRLIAVSHLHQLDFSERASPAYAQRPHTY